MMPDKDKKKGFDKLGWGALAIYVSLMGAIVLGVYGINASSMMMDQNRSDRMRQQVRSGRMVVTTADRTQCRTIRFDNETAELGRETLTDCGVKAGPDPGSTISVVRDGFNTR